MAFIDLEDDPLSYALTISDDSEFPSWLSFDESTRTISGTVNSPDIDVVNLKLIVSDDVNDAVEKLFTLEVNNLPIYIGVEPFELTVEVDKQETLVLSDLFKDPENVPLTFSATYGND